MDMRRTSKIVSALAAAGLLLHATRSLIAQQSGQAGGNEARIEVTTELVLVNVVARDKKGNLVKDLKKEDFTLFEDNKAQRISTFDFEDVDLLQTAGAGENTVTGTAGENSPGNL